MEKGCVYKISFDGTDMIYIGQTLDFKTRCKVHLSSLKRGVHHNTRMQLDFSLGKIRNPVFTIIEYATPNKLIALERHHILLSKQMCFNWDDRANNASPAILPLSDIGTIYTETTKEQRDLLRSHFGNLGVALKYLAENGGLYSNIA